MSSTGTTSAGKKFMGIGCLPVVAIVVGIGWLIGQLDPNADDAGNEYGAKQACHEWVKDQLKSPSTADFSGETVTGDSSGWTITGDVDSENGFGAMLRSTWTCTVRLTGDTYRGNATVF